MILVEIPENFSQGENIIKYKDVDDLDWYYLHIDIETLNLLINNFGILSTRRIPTKKIILDNATTGRECMLNYCGAKISLQCKNNVFANQFICKCLEENH